MLTMSAEQKYGNEPGGQLVFHGEVPMNSLLREGFVDTAQLGTEQVEIRRYEHQVGDLVNVRFPNVRLFGSRFIDFLSGAAPSPMQFGKRFEQNPLYDQYATKRLGIIADWDIVDKTDERSRELVAGHSKFQPWAELVSNNLPQLMNAVQAMDDREAEDYFSHRSQSFVTREEFSSDVLAALIKHCRTRRSGFYQSVAYYLGRKQAIVNEDRQQNGLEPIELPSSSRNTMSIAGVKKILANLSPAAMGRLVEWEKYGGSILWHKTVLAADQPIGRTSQRSGFDPRDNDVQYVEHEGNGRFVIHASASYAAYQVEGTTITEVERHLETDDRHALIPSLAWIIAPDGSRKVITNPRELAIPHGNQDSLLAGVLTIPYFSPRFKKILPKEWGYRGITNSMMEAQVPLLVMLPQYRAPLEADDILQRVEDFTRKAA